ncbi:hypothetical protein HPB50_013467 [Hyalomma asiaticum]|uniref:Uncharacterized protein n=1 Tax=Hyalomma asiaticum TaxID=266040 RepID=A0ACB7S9H8_HYAAI|nr:hypothetical protein HPB50_013467 [Hyalomma asiaticum]
MKPRRRATSHKEVLAIVAAVVDNARCSAQDIKVNLRWKASKSTVKRRLYQAGLKSRTAARKVLLLTSNKDKRLQFAQRHAGWIEQEWKKVIFTDESTFTTCLDQKTRIWRPDCARYRPEYVQRLAASGKTVLSVWGCISMGRPWASG